MRRDAKPEDNLIVRVRDANTLDKLAALYYQLYEVEQIDPYHYVPLAAMYHPTLSGPAREKLIEMMKKSG